MSAASAKQNKFLSSEYINGVYIPSGLLVFGCLIVKKEWVPFAVALAALLGGFKIWSSPLLTPVCSYRFSLPKPTSILGLPIGQHISIAATLTQPDGQAKEIVRSYTPVSGDHQPGYFDLLIKSYPTGNISKHMASLTVGQTIKVRGPKGAMVYTPNMVRHFGMIAGGTGITPMLQIIRAVIRGRPTGDKTEIDLIFANVNPEDILLKEDLDNLAAEDKGFRVHYVLNNPPEKWDGGVGFVTPEMISKWLPKPANDVKLLLCGPPPMISAMKKASEGLGFQKARPVSKLEDQVFAF
ncbi:nitrate reductase protein [Rutstroemia sp. NJR-2017a BBW]|nr:nitrate reductase protein [Rutstroemia sp. NJR-2017a BBW]